MKMLSLAPAAALGGRHVGQRAAGTTLPGHRISSVAAALRQLDLPAHPLTPAVLEQLLSPELARTSRIVPRVDLDRRERRIIERPVPVSTMERLRGRYKNFRRHIAFEYYPWYRTNPWEHWGQFDRNPPLDAATTMMPLLGVYNSVDVPVIEQHARWIADAGVGSINFSWWGPGSLTDRCVHLVMDIMRAHDIHVTFHIEPYANDRSWRFAEDIAYLIREYGDRRRWDNFLLLERANGVSGPVFKVFRSILPLTETDCLGRTTPIADYTPDEVWRQQITAARQTFARDFPITFLADSLNLGRTAASTFDGIAIYDNFVTPELWPSIEATFRTQNLVSSFNIHAGFHAIEPRGPQGPCYAPFPIAPPVGPLDWRLEADRARLADANDARIRSSLQTTTSLQAAEQSTNWAAGFFLVYINSFNEWHEGSSFEPAKNWADLTPEERAVGYHNPSDGGRRLRTLQSLLRS